MRKLLLLCLFSVLGMAQNVNNPSVTARRVVSAASLPATCTVGDVYFKTAATVGTYQCLTTNNWTAMGGGGSTSLTGGTGISVSPNPITGTGVITNTAPGAPPAGSPTWLQFNAGGGLPGASSELAYTTTSVNGAVVFSGAGLADMSAGGSYTDGAANPQATFTAIIDGTDVTDQATTLDGGIDDMVTDIVVASAVLPDGSYNSLHATVDTEGVCISSVAGTTWTVTRGCFGGMAASHLTGVAVTVLVDTFKWQKNSGSFTTAVHMTGSAQTLSDGVTVTFQATSGHMLTDQWLVVTATITRLTSSRIVAGPNGSSNYTNGFYFQDYNFVGQTGMASYVAIRDGARPGDQIYGLDGAVDDSNDSAATARNWLVGVGGEPYHASPGTLDALTGFVSLPVSSGGGTGLVTGIYGYYSKPSISGSHVTNEYGLWHQAVVGGGTTLPNAYGVYIDHTQAFGTVNLNVAFYSADQSSSNGGTIKNSYYSWFDSLGVLRTKEDASFDGVGQAITALYNPQFTKYVAGTPNYERLIQGEWNGNVAEIGNYAGGTGAIRNLRLLGPTIQAGTASNIANTTFTGAGLNDGVFNGTYTGTTLTYCAIIDGTGTPNTFKWGTNGACDNGAATVAITGANQTLSSGVVIKFAATTGHTVTNKWSVVATGAAVLSTLMDSTGAIVPPAYKTATNCANAASPAACGSSAAGAVAIPTGITTVTLVVNTTAITANSEISLAADDSVTIAATTCNNTLATLTGGLAVTARTPGTSFTITYNGTIATNPLCVTYKVMN